MYTICDCQIDHKIYLIDFLDVVLSISLHFIGKGYFNIDKHENITYIFNKRHNVSTSLFCSQTTLHVVISVSQDCAMIVVSTANTLTTTLPPTSTVATTTNATEALPTTARVN